MDWSNESYVRLYTKDTPTWRRLKWQGQAVLSLLLRKIDQSGVMDGIEDVYDDVSIATGLPIETAKEGLDLLLKYEVFAFSDSVLFMPNFLEAQTASKSDKQRQRESRDNRRIRANSDTKCDSASQNVTKSHTQSQGVTSGHSLPCIALPCDPIAKPLPSINKNPPAITKAIAKPKKAIKRTITSETWNAYSNAYNIRYGVKPVRNAQVNAQLKKFVERIGEKDAPFVAAYYLSSQNGYYLSRGHSVGILLADAEKNRTEWATGRKITQSEAREQDRLQGAGDNWQKIIDEINDKNEI